MRGVGVCNEDPRTGRDGGGEGRKTDEEVGDGFGELAGVEEAGVGVVKGFGAGGGHGCFGGDGGEGEMAGAPVGGGVEGGREIFKVGAEGVVTCGV